MTATCITLDEPIKAHLPPHDYPEVRKDVAESLLENAKLDRFAAVRSDTLGVFAQPSQAEPEIAFEPLANKIQLQSTPFFNCSW